MKFRQIQNGCGCDFQSHPFFVCGKMLPICPQNAPYLSLSDEPMNFCFSGRKNAPYLSPNHFNTFVSSLLYADENCGIISKKCSLSVPDGVKCSLSVPKMLPICRQKPPKVSPKTSQSVTSLREFCKMLPICPREGLNAPYLSSKTSQSVAKMLPICRQNAPYLSPMGFCNLLIFNLQIGRFWPLLLSTTIN